ncbi:RsmB/NOP family class I SAM-dependent RNA methyltransferase [Simiduia sp. 21SJ11W-1]|uniref:RsmB/NOP family class I SAM-dependent RNA methyltransferase n=1 Tax=Simiduia sp. 21SJ11W-1 TaxID=2909669 RepID=UPI00209D0B6D|nr:RsmB/NOP family class I SAM-dependent RNA methyltransferase [Simiduia sp. 21SJ11W-1]UTA48483.1 RsmB/NOP family class I SAM-dependent RNA methyltransferase [Simiduia sp. 21SJ11W-1]
MKASAPNFSDPRLAAVWQEWQKAPLGQALDKWLKYQLPKLHLRYEDQKTERGSLALALIEALRFQQLAMALEHAFATGTEVDWFQWDAQWRPALLAAFSPELLWGWVSLRVSGKLPAGRQYQQAEWAGRRDLFASLAPGAAEGPLEYLWHGLRPGWQPLLAARAQASGWQAKDVSAFIRAQIQTPPLWLRVQPELPISAACAQLLADEVNAKIVANELCAIGGRGVQGSGLYKRGLIEIQDLASQRIALAVGVAPGQKVWDACAGAGGKSLAIAAGMGNKGSLYATDLHEHKLKELKRRAKRANVTNIRSFTWNAERPLQLPKEVAQQQGFDWVLVDAPCTSTGTWRRNPDARWRFNDEDTQELVAIQKSILRMAVPAVREGGHLVYATCSWDVRENEQQVAEFLASHPGFRLISQTLLGCPAENSDTMFAAVLKRPVS